MEGINFVNIFCLEYTINVRSGWEALGHGGQSWWSSQAEKECTAHADHDHLPEVSVNPASGLVKGVSWRRSHAQVPSAQSDSCWCLVCEVNTPSILKRMLSSFGIEPMAVQPKFGLWLQLARFILGWDQAIHDLACPKFCALVQFIIILQPKPANSWADKSWTKLWSAVALATQSIHQHPSEENSWPFAILKQWASHLCFPLSTSQNCHIVNGLLMSLTLVITLPLSTPTT